MNISHAKAIRGLSIAVIVISGITLLCCIIGLFCIAIGSVALDEYGTNAIRHAHDLDYYSYSYGFDDDDIVDLSHFALAVGGAGVIWEILTCAVSLVAGIIGLRKADQAEKLGSVFGWGIAGAVAAILGGRIITCVLLVISAIFAHKDKEAALAGIYSSAPYAQPQMPPTYGQAAYGQQTVYGQGASYGQGAPQPQAQPATPYGQPQAQPATPYDQAYTQPTAYAQPATPYGQSYGEQAAYAAQAQPVAQPAVEPQVAVQTQPVSPAPQAQPAAEPAPQAQPTADSATPAQSNAESK